FCLFFGESASFEHMPYQAMVFGELVCLVVTHEIDPRVAGMRDHRRFPKHQQQSNGRAHAFLRRVALPQSIDVRTGFLYRLFHQTQYLGALLEGWGGDIGSQDSLLTTDGLLDEAHRFLARDFSGGMATQAIADDIEPQVWGKEAHILVVVTLATDVRLSRGGNTHVC